MPTANDRWKRALARRLIPSRIARALVRRSRNLRGDDLDPSIAVLCVLDRLTAGPPTEDVALRRAAMRSSCRVAGGEPPAMPVVDGRLASGLRFRRYGADGASAGLVWFHGGGWVVGDLDTHDVVCRRLAAESGRAVIAVDYPLAPEHPWPAPVHACHRAWSEAVEVLVERGVSAKRVAIGGDSAGGNLAAAVCRLVRGHALTPELQLLVYPGLDATCSRPSHREFADGYLLTEASIQWYLAQYRPDPLDPLASPVLADDLAGLAPAVIAVAGFDPLRDEGLWYAHKLLAAGVSVHVIDEPGLVHGYANMDGLVPEASRAVGRLAASLASVG